PIFGVLHAKNHLKYSGKSSQSRHDNQRKFNLVKKINNLVTLVNDVVSSVSSLSEAKQFLEKNKISVLFAVVLADAKV
ncbi:ComF family protein, partial [Campylobacter coli]